LRLDGAHVNQPIAPEQSAALFSRPALGSSVPVYDLARGPEQPYGNAQRMNARGFRSQ
jgi:hypothetical protein